MRLAAAPISWGVCEVPGWGVQLPRERVLDDAARLGFTAIEAGPPGFLPDDAAFARAAAEAYGLRVIGGFVTAVLHDETRLDAELATLERAVAWLAALGAEVLVLAPASGRDGYDAPAALSDREWETLSHALPRAREIARARALDAALHPHVGTAIESVESIDRVLVTTDMPLCLDTGHVFIGGADPARIAREHPLRVRHVHLKDVDGVLATRVRERTIGYAEAVARGLYRPLGRGDAPIAATLETLRAAGYDGWAVLEQDIALRDVPTEATDPVRDIIASREFALAHG